MEEIFSVQEVKKKQPKIAVIGVGISGCDTVREPSKSSYSHIKSLCIETSDENIYSIVSSQLNDADIIFVTTFLNDEEGMKIALKLSEYLKNIDTLNICVVPNSLAIEKKSKSNKAKQALLELQEYYQAVVNPETKILPNSLKAQMISRTLSDVAIYTIHSIVDIIHSKGKNDIVLDLEDLQTIMNGEISIASLETQDKDCTSKVKNMLVQLDKETNTLSTAKAIAVIFKIHSDFSLLDINTILDIFDEYTHDDINLTFTTSTDDTLSINTIRMTTLISNFDDTHTIVNNIYS